MQRIIICTILTLVGLPLAAQALTLEGHLVQGGMAIGRVDPSATVRFQDKTVRVSPEGLFVIGFSRDAKLESQVDVHHASGTIDTHPVRIDKRTYKIQRIDGLPPRKVTPSKKDLDRIGREIALVNPLVIIPIGRLAINLFYPKKKKLYEIIGTQLEIGETLLEVTEVRNPCYQLNEMHPRLLKAVATKVDGQVRRNAGMMARVLKGGWVRPGDPVIVRSAPKGKS
jgi:hypothetical protein